MATVLLVGEQLEGSLRNATLSAVTFGKAILDKAGGGELIGLVIGKDISGAADSLAKYGLNKVLTCADDELEKYMAETYATVVAETAKSCSATHVISTATTFAKDLMPRVAALLEAGMASDVSDVEDGKNFVRPLVAGNALGRVEVLTDIVVATCRQTEWDAAAESGSAEIAQADGGDFDALGANIDGIEIVKSDRPELTDAAVVVSGGRGMKSGDNFSHVEALADAFGGAMGATRAACDAGMVPNDLQVGQTGKVVAPDLYVAIGVSGAIQHLAGMKSSKVIVAINKDEEAPIFEVADYGLVAKWEDTLDDFTEKVKSIKAG
jgi:electron transfer flavoprotein alpha subunit